MRSNRKITFSILLAIVGLFLCGTSVFGVTKQQTQGQPIPNPTLTGLITNQAGLIIPPASSSTVITVTASDNFHTFSTAPTYTLSNNTPTAGTRFSSRHTNTSGSTLQVTLPSVTIYSTSHGTTITSFWIGSGNTETLYWTYDSANTRFIVDGVPTPGYSTPFPQTASGTTDLWQSSLNQTLTGTTAITSFGSTSPTGTIVNVQCLAATPITYNATSMIIPGSASITTAAGDHFVALALGSGNWQIVRYTKRDGTALVNNQAPVTEVTLSVVSTTVTQTMVAGVKDQNAKVTLTGNWTLAFSGLAAGMQGNLRVIQDSTGGRTLALPANSRVNGSATTVTLLTAAAAENILSWYSPDGTAIRWTIGTY